MKLWRGWNIHVRTQLISVGPALLLTLLLTGFLTFNRLQDLRAEINHTGQLIASQLAPATEYGVISQPPGTGVAAAGHPENAPRALRRGARP